MRSSGDPDIGVVTVTVFLGGSAVVKKTTDLEGSAGFAGAIGDAEAIGDAGAIDGKGVTSGKGVISGKGATVGEGAATTVGWTRGKISLVWFAPQMSGSVTASRR
jgi:hypothetical protein